jgi:hypothetical protein
LTVKIEVDVSDVEAFAEALRQMPEQLRERFAGVLGEIGQQIVVRARAYAPVRTGALRASIYQTVTRDLVLRVGAYVYYAIFQEFGTRYIAPSILLDACNSGEFAPLGFRHARGDKPNLGKLVEGCHRRVARKQKLV